MLTLNICCCCKCPLYRDWGFFDEIFPLDICYLNHFQPHFWRFILTSEVSCNWPRHCKEFPASSLTCRQFLNSHTVAMPHWANANTPLPLQQGIGINSPYEVKKLLAFFGANIYSERQQFDKYHTLPFFFN